MHLNKKTNKFSLAYLLYKYQTIFIILIICISCSQISILENSHIPKSISFQKSIKLPFIPDKICYCSFSNTFLLLNASENLIYRIDYNGKVLQKIGEFGFERGQFVSIADITTDNFGNLFVVDKVINKVVEYDEMGQFINSISFSELAEPILVEFKDNGDLILYDSPTNEIYCFDNRRKLRYNFGQFILNLPISLVSSNNVNYVLDKGNNNIIVFDNFGGIITTIESKNEIINISTNKNILYYIDSVSNIFCYKNQGRIRYKLASLNDFVPIISPKFIITYKKVIGIIDKNNLYIFQLTTK
ncbi:MAG: hypothetical protein J7J77_03265 [Candidatus Cloacimonetes bacterium]|nr:hypothetical protein [Candidatus Cloacimonadota bacterium]